MAASFESISPRYFADYAGDAADRSLSPEASQPLRQPRMTPPSRLAAIEPDDASHEIRRQMPAEPPIRHFRHSFRQEDAEPTFSMMPDEAPFERHYARLTLILNIFFDTELSSPLRHAITRAFIEYLYAA
jgi:hypothetical protein